MLRVRTGCYLIELPPQQEASRRQDVDVIVDDELNGIDAEVLALIDAAVEEAIAAPLPTAADLTTDVYSSY